MELHVLHVEVAMYVSELICLTLIECNVYRRQLQNNEIKMRENKA